MKSVLERGSRLCRGCNSTQLSSVLNLGSHPLPSEYFASKEMIANCFPLHLHICENCGLGQIGEFVPPERIFHEFYPYISSVSSTWVQHTKNYAEKIRIDLNLDSNSLVIEIASNDGGLLSEFKKYGIKVLGIEPAKNVATLSQQKNIPTIIDFFGENMAKDILEKFGYPSLIIANNVFAHVPDMQDFTKGLAILCNKETVITIENPSFLNLLQNALFDTIYHEHYSYLSTHSVSAIAQKFGLNLIRVEKLPTHGGSNRYWIVRGKNLSYSIQDELENELSNGLFNSETWSSFADRSQSAIVGLRNWLIEKKNNGETIAGFGAAHKGNSFLNAVGEESKYIDFVVDGSTEKQGKYLPGTQIPVYAPDTLKVSRPANILVLPWNIKEELSISARSLSPNSKIWVAQPYLHQVVI